MPHPILDAAMNQIALEVFEAMDTAALRPVIDITGALPGEMHDITLDGSHDAFLVSGDRFETAIDLRWNWEPGVPSLSEDRSGTAYGRIVDGAPVVERIVVTVD